MIQYIQTAVHEAGVVSVLPIPADIEISQVKAIEVSEKTWELFEGEAETLRLYRVDQETGEIAHVQTWTAVESVALKF
jgi:6-phosphogluconolactonase (cycloisomerase 2 family)